jgi:hypothetical protein
MRKRIKFFAFILAFYLPLLVNHKFVAVSQEFEQATKQRDNCSDESGCEIKQVKCSIGYRAGFKVVKRFVCPPIKTNDHVGFCNYKEIRNPWLNYN